MGMKPMDIDSLKRRTWEVEQNTFFEFNPDWRSTWWGMPSFEMRNASPQYRIVVNFMTAGDVRAFAEKTGLSVTTSSDSVWFPHQQRLALKEWFWKGRPSPCKYPVYIPSKGRADCATTPALLEQAGVKFNLVVEPQEADDYHKEFGDCILILPFSNLGQGSIPARNWIWEHAEQHGHAWHWILDDNILGFWRTHMNRRLVVKRSSSPLRIVEDFADRFDNLAFAGLSADGFCPDRQEISPYTLNTRVYSVTLIKTSLPYRWRGLYNEDTDICLRALKDGWVTVLFRSMLMKKAHTSRGLDDSGMKGGNTDSVYNAGDHRRAFAESLRKQHPDCVEVVWKFGRWHHQVDYSKFKRNRLVVKSTVTPVGGVNEYGLELMGKSAG